MTQEEVAGLEEKLGGIESQLATIKQSLKVIAAVAVATYDKNPGRLSINELLSSLS